MSSEQRTQSPNLRAAPSVAGESDLRLVREILGAIAADSELPAVLQISAEAVLKHLGAALARVWTLPFGSSTLELQASAGLYTHINGPHARVPVGAFKIGLIASEGKPHITNDVQNDPRVGNAAWAKQEGLVAFAGYPLICNGSLVGVAAMFSKSDISAKSLDMFDLLASALAARIHSSFSHAALLAAKSQSELIIESVPNGLLLVNSAGIITLANHQSEKIFGHSRADLIGQHLEILIPVGARPAHPGHRHSFFNKPQARAMGSGRDLFALRRDGSEFPVEIGLSPIQVANETLVLCSVVDITERKRNENKVVEAARLKSEFLANISHELRTPINVLMGMSSLLLESQLNPDQHDLAEALRKGAESLLVVVNDTLDFSKLEAGKFDIESYDFSVPALVEDVAELLSQQASVRGLELTACVAPNVPEYVRGDSARISQILTNLVSNAIKFTPQGEVALRVTLNAGPSDLVHLRFEIRDTGIGITSDAQSRLFKPFSQADGSTTRKYGGTGLGLAICKSLAELMHGSIGVESQIDRGSLFWFQLPLTPAVDRHEPDPTANPNLAHLRALIVDDNCNSQIILRQHLESCNARADLASNSVQALSLIRQASVSGLPYHAVLLDLRMPGVNGLELARLIRAENPDSPPQLILLTSFNERTEIKETREIGISRHLVKPLRRKQLLRALQSAPSAAHVSRGQFLSTLSPRHCCPPILLVEDNLLNQKLAMRLLVKHGYHCDVANNGAEALDRLHTKPYGLILMDCQMPVMDGFQATTAIRQLENGSHHTPIVAVTAHSMLGYREKCLAAGMDDYVCKPIDEKGLVATIERWLLSPDPQDQHLAQPYPLPLTP